MCKLLPFALLLVLATRTIDVGTFNEIATLNSAHSTSLLCSYNRNYPITAVEVDLCLWEWDGRTNVLAQRKLVGIHKIIGPRQLLHLSSQSHHFNHGATTSTDTLLKACLWYQKFIIHKIFLRLSFQEEDEVFSFFFFLPPAGNSTHFPERP